MIFCILYLKIFCYRPLCLRSGQEMVCTQNWFLAQLSPIFCLSMQQWHLMRCNFYVWVFLTENERTDTRYTLIVYIRHFIWTFWTIKKQFKNLMNWTMYMNSIFILFENDLDCIHQTIVFIICSKLTVTSNIKSRLDYHTKSSQVKVKEFIS